MSTHAARSTAQLTGISELDRTLNLGAKPHLRSVAFIALTLSPQASSDARLIRVLVACLLCGRRHHVRAHHTHRSR